MYLSVPWVSRKAPDKHKNTNTKPKKGRNTVEHNLKKLEGCPRTTCRDLDL